VIDATRGILEQFASGRVPEAIPSDALCAEELMRLAEYLSAVQNFTVALASGDLSASLKGFGGPVAGGLKSLQASLRHLAWQTRQVAAGDFSQRVDFMGDFSAGFNAMVARLSETRAEMESMNVRLREELACQRKLAEELREEQERFRLITENVNAVIWTMDAVTLRFTYVGPYITRLRGVTVEEAQAETFPDSLTPASRLLVMEKMAKNKARFLETADVSVFFDSIEVEQVCKDGRIIPVEMVISAITDNGGNLKEFLGISRDISSRKAAEKELTYLSSHDSLTGLYNRAFLDVALKRSVEGGTFPLSIIVADLDGLKLVNDSLGHAAGDRLIRGAATVLRKACRADDVIARTGGDEFVVLLQHMDEDEATQMLMRVRRCEKNFNRTEGGPPVRLSLGRATARGGEDVMQALTVADSRMYADKALRKRKRG
jgi:diguanylate cyclase (GGDEF)-like protein/PAS domain S-box-containing protein